MLFFIFYGVDMLHYLIFPTPTTYLSWLEIGSFYCFTEEARQQAAITSFLPPHKHYVADNNIVTSLVFAFCMKKDIKFVLHYIYVNIRFCYVR
jgi:hypothetical protein